MRAAVAHGNSVRTTSGLEPLEGRLRSFRKERGWTPCAGRDSGNRDADPPRPADLTSFDPPLPHCPGSRPALARSVVDLRRGPLRRTRPRGLSLALVIPATAARGRACRTREGVRARTASSPTGNGGESLAPVCRWCFRPGETVHAARSRTMMGKATPLTGAGTRSGPGPRPGAPPRYPGVGRGGTLVSRSSPVRSTRVAGRALRRQFAAAEVVQHSSAIAHWRTIGDRSSSAIVTDGVDDDAELENQVLARGRSIAREPRRIREQGRGGRDGGALRLPSTTG